MIERNGASIRNIAEVLWETPPAHYDAHSKMLVTPETAATRRFDHRISSYQQTSTPATFLRQLWMEIRDLGPVRGENAECTMRWQCALLRACTGWA